MPLWSQIVSRRTTTWTGPTLSGQRSTVNVSNGSGFINEAGKSFVIAVDDSGSNWQHIGGTASTFTNEGTVRKTVGGPGSTNIGAVFTNSGTTVVEAGTLTMSFGGQSSGVFDVRAGNRLNLAGFTLTAGSQTLGSAGASLAFYSGFSTIQSSTYTVPTTIVSGATAIFEAGMTLPVLTVSGFGTADFRQTSSLGNVTLSDDQFNNTPTLTGSGNVTVTGTLDWESGTLSGSGTLTIASVLNIKPDLTVGQFGANTDHFLNGKTIRNQGTTTWTGPAQPFQGRSNVNVSNGAAFINEAGKDFVIAVDDPNAQWQYTGGTIPTFSNAGTLRKTVGGAWGTNFGAVFSNSGSAVVEAGTLTLSFGGQSSGLFDVATASRLNLAGYTLTSASQTVGTGSASLAFFSC